MWNSCLTVFTHSKGWEMYFHEKLLFIQNLPFSYIISVFLPIMELKRANKLANVASYLGNGWLHLYVWRCEAVEDYVIWENDFVVDRSIWVVLYIDIPHGIPRATLIHVHLPYSMVGIHTTYYGIWYLSYGMHLDTYVIFLVQPFDIPY